MEVITQMTSGVTMEAYSGVYSRAYPGVTIGVSVSARTQSEPGA